MEDLYRNTVSKLLAKILSDLMKEDLFSSFRLVGGTALSLQLGHRMSEDIDLFCADDYGSVDFKLISDFLQTRFPYVDSLDIEITGMGKSYFVGSDQENAIKLDLYYTDPFIKNFILKQHIRMAHLEDIAAMKMDVISRTGRKKDFWDIHELLSIYSISELFEFHKKRYPYIHNPDELKEKLIDFSFADQDFEPICLKGKHWDLIKLDFIDIQKSL